MTIKTSSSPQLRWLVDMMNLFASQAIIIPKNYRDQVLAVKELLKNDTSGIVNSILDFSVTTSQVNYTIETGDRSFDKILSDWLFNINSAMLGKIPVGVKALSKQYFLERWKGSSHLLLMTKWKKQDDWVLPYAMWFLDGEDIVVNDGEGDINKIGDETYHILTNPRTKASKKIISNDELKYYVQKPYDSWSTLYPTPFLIRRGLFRNLKFLELLASKGETIVQKAIEYFLMMKKGSEALANNPDFVYSDEELKKVVEGFKEFLANRKLAPADNTSIYASNFDTDISQIIPEYEKAVRQTLFEAVETRILAGLGLIDIIEGIGSTRREAILNPKPLKAEIVSAVDDFAQLLSDVIRDIVKINKSAHPKKTNIETIVRAEAIKEFQPSDFKATLRSLYDRGLLSKQSAVELIGEIDFETEVVRRTSETEEDLNETMYPPVIQNMEAIPDTTENLEDVEDILPDRAPGSPEAKNFDKAFIDYEDGMDEEEWFELAFAPRVTENYVRLRQRSPSDFEKNTFRIVTLSKSKGIKAVVGRLKGEKTTTIQAYLFDKKKWSVKEAEDWVSKHKGSEEGLDYEEAPWSRNEDLPESVKVLPSGAQTIFRKAANDAFRRGADETTAMRIGWSAVKRAGYKKVNDKWTKQ